MHIMRAGNQIEEGQIEQISDLLAGPVGPSDVLPRRREYGAAGDPLGALGSRLRGSTGDYIKRQAAFSSGGILWPSSFNTSAAASARLVPGPKMADTPASYKA